MKTTKQIVDEYNEKLFAKLFGNCESEPIECNSVLSPKDEAYNFPFSEVAKKHLKDILEEEEFYLEFETIKNKLDII